MQTNFAPTGLAAVILGILGIPGFIVTLIAGLFQKPHGISESKIVEV